MSTNSIRITVSEWSCGALLCLATALIPHLALAENATIAPESQIGSSTGLEEIIVTATKRDETLIHAPISVAAVTSQDIANMDFRSVADLQIAIPSLDWQDRGGIGSPFIRGVGTQGALVGLEPAIAVYYDDAYIQRQSGDLFEAVDLDNVQVLRGPQGTLYGRNATGGAILVNTKDPTSNQEAFISAEEGNYDRHKYEFALNQPISDQLAVRIAGAYREEGGYIYDITTHGEIGGGRSRVLRGKLKWTPSDSFSAILESEYNTDYGDYQIMSPRGQAPECVPCAIYHFNNPVGDYITAANAATSTLSWAIFNSLRMHATFGAYAFDSISAHRSSRWDIQTDSDFTQGPLVAVNPAQENGDTFTQEFRLRSNYSAPFNFMVGANYEHDDGILPFTLEGDAFGPLSPVSNISEVKLKSYSGFAEIYYDLTPLWQVTAGARYSTDTKDFSASNNANATIAYGNSGQHAEKTFTDTTPRFVISRHTDWSNYYFSYNKGFKAGGFNTPALGITQPVEPETIESFEIGAKNEFFDHRLRTTLSVFHYNYKDVQVSHVDIALGGIVLQNAASQRTTGLEFDTKWAATSSLTLGLGGSILHAYYDKFTGAALLEPAALGFQPIPGGADLSGTVAAFSPKFAGVASADYKTPFISGWSATTSGDIRYTSTFDTDPGAGSTLQLDKRQPVTLFNLTESFVSPNGHLRLGLWGHNLFNKYYDEDYTTQTVGILALPGRPRTAGVSVRYDWR